MSYPNESSINVNPIYPNRYQDSEKEVITDVYEYDEKGNVIKMTRTITKQYPQYPTTPVWTCDASKRWDTAVDGSVIYNKITSVTASA